MRYATANNLGNTSYSTIVDSCQHSRLKAALGGGYSAPAPRALHQAVRTLEPVVINDTSKAYLWVVAMSVVSLLSLVVGGTLTA